MNQSNLVLNSRFQMIAFCIVSLLISITLSSCVSCTQEEEKTQQQMMAEPKTVVEQKLQKGEVKKEQLTAAEVSQLKKHREADKLLYGRQIKDPEEYYFPGVKIGAPKGQLENPKKAQEKFKSFKSGLKFKDLKNGTGLIPEPGGRCLVHYNAWLSDGTKFDTTIGKTPLYFRYTRGQVIRGLDEGVTGMKVGGSRKLIIPPHLAYGKKGNQKLNVPPNETLTFVIMLCSAGR